MPTEHEMLAMEGVTKRFGDVVALDLIAVGLNRGEIHAVIGENGAGKSTLMRILAGHLAADSGSMVLEGRQEQIESAIPGKRPNVGFVEQEGGLVAELTGSENLILSEGRGFWSNRKEAGDRLMVLAKQFEATIDPDVPINSLPMGQRQRLEILIILARGARILILDEPTAALSLEDAKTLGGIIRKFVSSGGAVFYISHKLKEVSEIADRITVMRRGKVVGRHLASEVTVVELASEMVGEVTQFRSREQSGSATSSSGDLVEVAMGVREEVRYSGTSTEVCVLTGASVFSTYQSESNLRAIDFSVKAGEVVGVAGVVGSGQTMLAEVLAGVVTPHTGSLNRASGPIAYIPENRHRDALALSLSIRDNLIVHMHKSPSFAKGPWLRRDAIDAHIADTLSSSRVYGAVQDAAASSLSGGNQQKLVLGRELEQKPVLLVAHNPFRGLDVRAIQDVREAINAACRAGCGVVMISSDLDELAQLAHRIVVLFAGRLVGEVDLQKDGSEALGRLIGGVAHDGAF
jgi:ABC-type uncharacterized transport system ATPase subunit